MKLVRWLLPALLCAPLLGANPARSPYAREEASSIKALGTQEQADLLDGKGMGFAKAAELNGYPGPRHVLELATQLELTPAQRAETQVIFERMQKAARQHGAALVAAEAELDRLYATRSATAVNVDTQLAAIEAARTRIRAAHLQAHLDQAALLSSRQVAEYSRLRGYSHPQEHVHPHAH